MDEVDRRIASLLGEDGRRSNRELGRLIGVTEGTIRNRIQRLLSENVMQIVAGVNPEWQGYTIDCSFSLRVEQPRLRRIAEYLATLSETRYIALTSGVDDVRFTAMFVDHDHLAEFSTNTLARVEGIIEVRTSIALKTIKHTYDWRPVPHTDPDCEDGIESNRSSK
ncbi:Lrp/AsnC family transcriptional regulator [Rhodococcus sp. WS4]|nr:Lrp/AsnC family transcriptional regulator [Rhodococcus sp. WS4]